MDWNDLDRDVLALRRAQADIDRQAQTFAVNPPDAAQLEAHLKALREQVARLARFMEAVNRLRQ